MAHLSDHDAWAIAAGEGSPSLREHAAVCALCHARVEEASGVRRLARAARPPEPSAGTRAAALDGFERAMAVETRRHHWWLDRWPMIFPSLGLAAAAGAAAAVLFAGPAPQGLEVAALAPAAAPVARAEPAATATRPAAVTEPESPTAPQSPVAPAHRPPAVRPRRAAPAAVVAALPAPLPLPEPVAAPVAAPPEPGRVEVEVVEPRYERLEPARVALAEGNPAEAVSAAMSVLAVAGGGEALAAWHLVRQAALGSPTEDVAAAVDAAARAHPDHREALLYLACESSVLGRRATEAVGRCRSFVEEYPQALRARDASYVAGTLAREAMQDCAGAVEDYRKALLFTGALGSLNDDALFWRAHCLAELGRVDDARTDLQQYVARYPGRRTDARVRDLQARMRH